MKKLIFGIISLLGIGLTIYSFHHQYKIDTMYSNLMDMKKVFTYKKDLSCKALKEVFTSDNYTCIEKNKKNEKEILLTNEDFALNSNNFIKYDFRETSLFDLHSEGQTKRKEYTVFISYKYEDEHELKVKEAIFKLLKKDGYFFNNLELRNEKYSAYFKIGNITRRLNPLQIPIDKTSRDKFLKK